MSLLIDAILVILIVVPALAYLIWHAVMDDRVRRGEMIELDHEPYE